jgi:hypothetical protein
LRVKIRCYGGHYASNRKDESEVFDNGVILQQMTAAEMMNAKADAKHKT